MNKAIDTVLGKNTTEYKENYAPDYLVAIDRQDNRSYLNISSENPPFTGFDVWHDYEASFLCQGIPINGILKIRIPAVSPFTVESKSLKLYLFSYIMEEMGSTEAAAIANYETRVRKDLSALCKSPVEVSLHRQSGVSGVGPRAMPGASGLVSVLNHIHAITGGGVTLTSVDLDLRADNVRQQVQAGTYSPSYKEAPDILRAVKLDEPGSFLMHTSMLKSNCKVTHQPDWGSIYIYMEGLSYPREAELLKYIISFRNENHFHEEIVECVFKRLLDKLQPDVLDVMAFYTRRGGIDICPMRSTRSCNVFNRFGDMGVVNYREFRS